MDKETRVELTDNYGRAITYVVKSGQTGKGISISKLVDGNPASGVELNKIEIEALMKHLTSPINQ